MSQSATSIEERTSGPAESRPLSAWLAPAVLLVATLAVLWPVLTADFVLWDDQNTVWRNPLLQPPTLHTLYRYWTWPAWGLYTPVTYTIWSAVALLSPAPELPGQPYQLLPATFHATNLVFHVLNVLLAWSILRTILRTRSASTIGGDVSRADWCACAGAMLFAIHPLQVESVAWVSGLKDLLGGLFTLITIWQYQISVDPNTPDEDRRIYRALAVVATILAVFSKPSAVVLPAILFVLDWLVWKRPIRQILRSIAPVFACCLAVIIGTQIVQHPAGIPLWQRPILACYTFTFYVMKLIAPLNLAPDYGRPPSTVLRTTWLWASWIVPLLCALGLWRMYMKRSLALAGALIALLTISPVLGLVPFGTQDQSTVSDHYLYVPIFGLALMLAAVLMQVRKAGVVAVVACVVVFALLGFRSCQQARVWQNTSTLFTHNLKAVPWSWRSETNLGIANFTDGRYAEAEQHLLRSIAMYPSYGAFVSLAECQFEQHRRADAIASAQQAVAINPGAPDAHVLLATIYFKTRQPDKAMNELEVVFNYDANEPRAKALLPAVQAALKTSQK